MLHAALDCAAPHLPRLRKAVPRAATAHVAHTRNACPSEDDRPADRGQPGVLRHQDVVDAPSPRHGAGIREHSPTAAEEPPPVPSRAAIGFGALSTII